MKRVISGVVGVVVLTGLATGCGKIAVKGAVTVADADSVSNTGGLCDTDGSGYDDIAEGANVVIKDSKGNRVALGTLDFGSPTSDGACKFTFEVSDVPKSDIYSIAIGHRSDYTFKQDEAKTLDLTIGGS